MDFLPLDINPLFIASLYCIIGLALLYFGGNKLVDGAVFLAEKMKVSTLFIGVAVIGLGTSLPEIMSTVSAVKLGSADLAYGNIIGSNIANISLVLALGLLMTAHVKAPKAARQEYLFMLAAIVIFCAVVLFFGGVSKIAGILLILALIAYLVISLISGKNTHGETEEELEEELHLPQSLWVAVTFVIAGLFALFFGADLMVNGAVTIAQSLGVSEKIIGLTLVAVGTSLPEIAATVAAARHGQINLTIGNVAGSNIFNVLAAGGVGGITGHMFAEHSLLVDLAVMFAFSLIMGYLFLAKEPKTRLMGISLLVSYAAYLTYLAI